jgi:uncharacterized RDD family membrane protein YckC
MSNLKSTTGLGEGVFYARRDYIPFIKRLLIMVIDLAVVVAVGFVLAMILGIEQAPNDDLWLYLFWFILSWFYLTIIEASPWGTLGFLMTGARIVNLRAQRPSVFRMTFRLVLWIFGPFHFVLDLIWLAGDERCQMCGTRSRVRM